MRVTLPAGLDQLYLKRLEKWESENFATGVWKKDYTLWKANKGDDKELSNRLGWLTLPSDMQNVVEELTRFAGEIRKEFTEIILLGMGGSSLAPEVLFNSFGRKEGYPSLSILDSTHPDAVKKKIVDSVSAQTLFIVSSKSGTTVETSSFMHTAFNAVSKLKKNAGSNFIAITDPGTILETYAKENQFRRIFNTPGEVGGRYSALTYFGLVPAALTGIDTGTLLNSASQLMNESKKDSTIKLNDGYRLGAALGELALNGKDKIILTASHGISSFPSWIEQLIAESTGKEGKGILPVIENDLFPPEKYHLDNVVVYLHIESDEYPESGIKALLEKGIPVIEIKLKDKYDLGYQFYTWELATAMASTVLRINPFDQPNVQLAKTLASEAINEFRKKGKTGGDEPSLKQNNILAYSDKKSGDLKSLFGDFMKDLEQTSYVCIMAFVNPDEKNDFEIIRLKNIIGEKYGTVVTTGYGPRFLHSTGQLHKGDANKGFFIQLTSDPDNDIVVPGQGYSFGLLISAQAQGDLKALKNMNRRVIRFHFTGNTAEGINSFGKIIRET